jgi:tetratricopeptide (TPR) repeat protein
MSGNELDPSDEQYELLLADCDEVLAIGQSTVLPTIETPAELRPGMERDLECIKLLRQWGARAAPTSEAKTATALPAQFGRFEIRRELGRGGFGVVFLAFDTKLRREVALKVPRADALVTPELRARFHQEARAASGLDHINLVQVYEAGEIGVFSYIAYAFCPGVTLTQWLEQWNKPVACTDAAALLVKLAEAVQHAHNRGVLHRDLKPDNILMTGLPEGSSVDGSVKITKLRSTIPKITDFGLAKILPGESSAGGQEVPTVSGAIVGTPNYMSPEQAAGNNRDITTAVDVHALGAILYKVLTGRPPFQGLTQLETLEQVRMQEPTPPRRLCSTIDKDLDTICRKCLQKDPNQRYANAQALAEDLHRYLAGKPILARPVSLGERIRKWAKRRPSAAALIGVSVLALLTLAAGGVWHVTQLRAALQLAEDREKESNEQWRRAEHNAVEAEQHKRSAEQRYRQAAEAVRLMLSRVGKTRLANMPYMEQLRRELLEDALQFNLGLLKEKNDDPSMRAETARVHREVGGIYQLLGKHREAEEAARASLALFDGLISEFPDKPEYQVEQAVSWNSLGDLLRNLARPEQTEQAIRQGLSILVEVTQKFPDVPAYRNLRANSHRNLGTHFVSLGSSKLGEQSFREAVAIQQELTTRYPEVVVYSYELASTLSSLSVALSQQGRSEEAEKALVHALPLMEKSAAEFGHSRDYRFELAGVHNNLAMLRLMSNHYQEAEKPCRDAIVIQEKLVADYPRVPSYWSDLGGSYHNLFAVLTGLKRWPEATKAFDKAYAIRRRLVTECPDVADYQCDLGDTLAAGARSDKSLCQWSNARKLVEMAIGHHLTAFKPNDKNARYRNGLYQDYNTLAECLVELGEHRDAVKAAAELPKLYPTGNQAQFTAARLIAFCATLAGKDARLNAMERAILLQAYGAMAMEKLREERRNGQLRAETLRQDIVFEPLRPRNDFQQLLSELDRSSPERK